MFLPLKFVDRKSLIVFVLILCFTTLTGCQASTSTSGNKDTLTVAMPTNSENSAGFDPIHGWAVSEHTHNPLIFSTLFKTDKDLNITCDLATDYSFSEDLLILQVSIRDDVYFFDGSKLTSQDVVFTIISMKDAADNVIDLTSVDSVTYSDDWHLTFQLNKPDPNLVYTLSTAGIVKSEGYDSAKFGKEPIGSGMFKLESWNVGQSARLVYNDKYYGTCPEIKNINVMFMDEDAASVAVESGSVDIAYTTAKHASRTVSGYELKSVKSNDARGISLPCVDSTQGGNDVTSHIEVRQALNLCIDKETLVKNCLDGYGSSAYSVCDNTPWSNSNLKISTDRHRAEELLENGGWTKDENGIRLSFNLYYSSADSTRQALAYEFANQASTIGIKVNLIGTNWDEIYKHQYSDAVLWGWGSNTPAELCNILRSDGSSNFPQFKSSEIDACLNAGQWQKAQEYADFDNASSWVWLCNLDHLYFARTTLNIGNQQIHPHGHGWSLLNNIEEMYWQ